MLSSWCIYLPLGFKGLNISENQPTRLTTNHLSNLPNIIHCKLTNNKLKASGS
jgi:hypothetical protein